MSRGKKLVPVRLAAWAGPRRASAAGPSRVRIGLKPRKAANRLPTGGRWAIRSAVAGGTPLAVRPLYRVVGSRAASPAIISEKNSPMESTHPAFWKVARMPEAAPRWRAGALFVIPAVLGV